MRILVTNDDGIQSPGLEALAAAMRELGEVLVVAPDKQQSGVGSSVSLHNGMTVSQAEFPVTDVRAYAVGGTPSDCVMLGLRRLTDAHIDLLVSGINLGPNVGRDILYSGTVMATLQGYYRNISAIAVSLLPLTREEKLDFRITANFTKSLVQRIQAMGAQPGAVLNVNVPNLPKEQIKGVRTTRTAGTGYVSLNAKPQAQGVKYSLKLDKNIENNLEEDTDIWAIHHGYISVTPLQFNITHHGAIPGLDEQMKQIKDIC